MKELRPDPVERALGARPEDCWAALDAVEAYPEWLTGVEAVEVVERDAGGRVTVARVTMRLELAGVGRSFSFTAEVEREELRELILRRRAGASSKSEQRLVVRWLLAPEGTGTRVRLEMEASVDLPRLVPVGGAADTLARNFADALGRRVGA